MSRNPYADPTGAFDERPPDSPRRVSGLAVSSLIFGILCCLPGSGLIGVILGGAGLVSIAKSEGRLSGRTLAFAGLTLGILGTALWLAIGVGMRQGWAILGRQVFEPTVSMMQALEKQDWAAAGKLISPSAHVGPEELRAFADKVKEEFGPVSPQPMDLGTLLTSQPNLTVQSSGTSTVLPLPVQFQQGTAFVVLITDSPATIGEVFLNGASLDGKLTNIGVVGDGSGKQVWLVGPAPSPATPPGSK
jgi:Domain of unknown function (DUF4190)